jgi:hypothetical protein
MEHDLFEGAACAGSDLTARLLADLARAGDCLALAEARLHAAAAGGAPDPRLRHEVHICRRHASSLRRMLSGMPTYEGGDRAASA